MVSSRALVADKYHPLLIALAKGDLSLQRNILKSCNDSFIRLLAQISLNLLYGNINISASQKRRLGKYKRILRKFANRRVGSSVKAQRNLLVRQTGGFLPFILPLVATAIGGLVSRVLK